MKTNIEKIIQYAKIKHSECDDGSLLGVSKELRDALQLKEMTQDELLLLAIIKEYFNLVNSIEYKEFQRSMQPELILPNFTSDKK